MTTGSRQDSTELYRGAFIGGLGYFIKLGYPVLLIAVVRLYGAEAFGIFTLVQAALLFAMRFCLLGLDKGLLWWVARQNPENERHTLLSVLITSSALSLIVSLIIAVFGAPLLAHWSGDSEAVFSFKLMAISLVPMTLMELLIHAILGKRRMEAQVFIRDGVVPLTLVGSALLFYFFGLRNIGFALAFITSAITGFLASCWCFSRIFRDSSWKFDGCIPPPELLKFSLTMWLAELANSFLLRMDIYLVAAMTDPVLTGIYAAVMQLGITIRVVRRSFDPIITALFSRISVACDNKRLTASFSRATNLVIVTQMPIYSFLILFSPWLMGLFGPHFVQGSQAVFIICCFWIISGAIGLNGLILTGFGRSDLTLLNVVVAILTEGLLLFLLVPRYGLNGAALSVGLAYTVQHMFQLFQARMVTGVWNYSRNVFIVLLFSLIAVSIIPVIWFNLADIADIPRRIISFAGYSVFSGCGVYVLHRTGKFA